MLEGALKLFYISCLTIIFFFYFGFPSLDKFLAKQTVMMKKIKTNEIIPPPAITMFPKLKWKVVRTMVLSLQYLISALFYSQTVPCMRVVWVEDQHRRLGVV